ncbi:MAG: hypothetical protein MSG64_04195 [Pyrinomonadaceae bacterium MAG19_C2-C3]|nr:hypothetical protein [Pyrinomonadaceae bacterium MAG19_C2-C3]
MKSPLCFPSASFPLNLSSIKTFALMVMLLCACSATHAQTPQELLRVWREQHVTRIAPNRVRHADVKNYLDGLKTNGTPVREVGRSIGNREIYEIEFGRGATKVFLWSQMHGDEPTATSALIDIFHFLQRNRTQAWVREIESKLTLRAVPMLNPDGAEIYQRRNLQNIDINRDARALVTPEGRLLKRLRDEWSPAVGFNLHNQNPRTSVGSTNLQAAISLLAVPFDERNSDDAGRIRNKKLCAVMIEALAPFIKNHIGRYDDTFNPRAFGDLISKWGTPVILIETGALQGKSEMDLVAYNFVAILSALNALADNSFEKFDPKIYETLPYNSSGNIFNLIVRGAHIVNRTNGNQPTRARVPPFVADIALNDSIQDVGDLSVFRGLEEVDASRFFVVAARSMGGAIRPGANDALLFYRRDRRPRVDFNAPNLEQRFPPDAVYRDGVWQGKEKFLRKP